MMLAMALSGALAGLAGSFMVIGTVGQLSLDLSGGIGFTAIALALLAGLRPSGVVVAALLFGALTSGGKSWASSRASRSTCSCSSWRWSSCSSPRRT